MSVYVYVLFFHSFSSHFKPTLLCILSCRLVVHVRECVLFPSLVYRTATHKLYSGVVFPLNTCPYPPN